MSRSAWLLAVVLLSPASSFAAEKLDGPIASSESYPARILEFPDDFSVGKLHVADPATTLPSNWQPHGEAQGNVQIPAGKVVSLRVYTQTALDVLFRLKPDDIQYLSLRRINVPRGGLVNVRHLTGLKRLVIAGNGILSDDLQYIEGMKRLEYLDASHTGINDEGLERIAKLENLRWLDVAYTRIYGRGLAQLGKLPKLEELNLNHTRIGSLAELKNCKSLRRLSISSIPGWEAVRDPVSGKPTSRPRDYSPLADLPLTYLMISAPVLTTRNRPPTRLHPQRVSILAGVKTLKVLRIGGDRVLSSIEEDLKKALPGVEIQWPPQYLKAKEARDQKLELPR